MMIFYAWFPVACLIARVSSRTLWVPQELQHDAALWAPEDFIPLRRRQDDTCGGFANLEQCGGSFPTDFCCSAGTTCLSLNTSSTITAALCCPAGQDCNTINPINCSEGLQNATQAPQSQLHSSPTATLEQCGTECCPMGYACRGSVCVAQTADEASSPSSPATSSVPPPSTSSGAGAKNDVTPIPSSSGSFSGKAFAAGFVPGLALGGLIVAGLILFCLKRRRRQDTSDEKRRSAGRDTLTDLGPYMTRRPMVHGRSISEPTADIAMGHRTEFLNSTPPYQKPNGSITGYAVTVNAPTTPKSNASHGRTGWLSHSPFMNYVTSPVPTQSPLPSHMKRGTLAHQITPVRALRKQRSLHSLRRHVTTAAHRSGSSASRGQKSTRSDSGETIKVLMSTPEYPVQPPSAMLSSAAHQPSSAVASSWPINTTITDPCQSVQRSTSTDDDSTPAATYHPQMSPESQPQDQTPTRPGRNSNIPHIGATLGLRSPYSPSNYPPTRSNDRLAVPGTRAEDERHRKMNSLWPPPAGQGGSDGAKWRLTAQTTFSGMMEKAGLRRSAMYMGPDPREWNR